MPGIINFAQSLRFYQNHRIEEKSTEIHNLRKASILAEFYLFHKLLQAGMTPHPDKTEFLPLCQDYATRYSATSAMVYDLKPYFVYFDSEMRETIVEKIHKQSTDYHDLIGQEADEEIQKLMKQRYY